VFVYNSLHQSPSQPNYVRTLEDEVELQRQKKLTELKEQGIKGTPITEESFKAWQARKRKKKEDAAKQLVEKELKKRKGGKSINFENLDFKQQKFGVDPLQSLVKVLVSVQRCSCPHTTYHFQTSQEIIISIYKVTNAFFTQVKVFQFLVAGTCLVIREIYLKMTIMPMTLL
jgi:hypothetical protein